MDQALIVFLKEPVPGGVKTRLCPPLTDDEACDLYRCFVEDALDQYARLSATGFDVLLIVSPRSGMAYYSEMARLIRSRHDTASRMIVECQVEGDLGNRLHKAFQVVFDLGYNGAVAIGSDHPSLPDDRITGAFEGLRNCDVVVGPCLDGGYYLLGLTSNNEEYFRDIPWSSNRVLEVTVGRIRELDKSLRILPEWYDVDDQASLDRLRFDLVHAAHAPACRTRAWLNGHEQALRMRSVS